MVKIRYEMACVSRVSYNLGLIMGEEVDKSNDKILMNGALLTCDDSRRIKRRGVSRKEAEYGVQNLN